MSNLYQAIIDFNSVVQSTNNEYNRMRRKYDHVAWNSEEGAKILIEVKDITCIGTEIYNKLRKDRTLSEEIRTKILALLGNVLDHIGRAKLDFAGAINYMRSLLELVQLHKTETVGVPV